MDASFEKTRVRTRQRRVAHWKHGAHHCLRIDDGYSYRELVDSAARYDK